MSEELPALLVDPPWEQEARAAAAATAAARAQEVPLVPGLESPTERLIVWQPGEREEWLREINSLYSYGTRKLLDTEGWVGVVQTYRDGKLSYPPTQADMFGRAPEELVRPLLAEWQPKFSGSGNFRTLRALVARFELDAYHVVFPYAKSASFDGGWALSPFLDLEVARLMADWLVRLKSQKIPRDWFLRHGLAVVPYLVPDALGKRRAPREKATAALSLIAATHGASEVVAAARPYGDAAASGIEQLLAGDTPPVVATGPVDKPAKPLKLPWLQRDQLPKVWLRDGRVLPAEAVENLIGALTLATGLVWNAEARSYPGLPETLELCDRDSLAAFGWALFDSWVSAGMPPRSGWVIDQFLWLADDNSVRQLGALLLRWPGVNTDKHAAGVLGEIGTDTALAQLHRITQRVKAPGLRALAEERLTRAAKRRGLTTEELADRLVPDLGLDADGTLALDYGSRRFTVGFDENLMPFVIDEAGASKKTLPKPGVKDDETLAPAAYRRFSELKKQARGVASDQIRRLELAMVSGRRWSTAEFELYLVAHPLLRHIARRLVWTTGDTFFRLAEDFTPTDIDDATMALPVTARIGIAHPVELGDAVSDWGDVFADYEITQPFPQLGRPVYSLTQDELDTRRIDRFEGVTVPVGALLGLTRKGWERGPAEDGGLQGTMIRRNTQGPDLEVWLEPGIAAGGVDIFPEQILREIRFTAGRLDELGPITASEILADLTNLT